MNDYHDIQETPETAVEVFDTDNLPTLDDLMRELEILESGDEKSEDEIAAFEKRTIVSDFSGAGNAHAGELKAAHERLLRLESENQELQTALKQVSGNFEKFRWRTERDRSEHYAFAVVSIIREFLPILDNFGRALQSAPSFSNDEKFSHFVGGVDLIYRQTLKFLADMGVHQIASVGEQFDPRVHEAIAIESNPNFPPNTVTEEILRGYRMGDKLIRPAMVKVSTNAE